MASITIRNLDEGLFITAMTEAEIRLVIALLPEGRRRDSIAEAAKRTFATLFAGRVLPFDSAAAEAYAAIAAARGAAVAARNVSDFQGCGVEVIDPWNRSH